jgi:hypothetical protein
MNGIHHALMGGIFWTLFNRNAPSGGGYVWPGAAADGNYQTAYGNTGPLYIGGLVAIPKTVNLATHAFNTIQGKNLAYALQQYGMYVEDGSGSFNTNVDHQVIANGEVPDVSYGTPFGTDLGWITGQLAVVTNSYNPTNGGPPRNGIKLDGGDGTINKALLAPPFATQYGGGNGRMSYFIPSIPRSLWAWLTRGVLN